MRISLFETHSKTEDIHMSIQRVAIKDFVSDLKAAEKAATDI